MIPIVYEVSMDVKTKTETPNVTTEATLSVFPDISHYMK